MLKRKSPHCIVDPDINNLVASMVQCMTQIADKSFELAKTKFYESYEMLDRVIYSELL